MNKFRHWLFLVLFSCLATVSFAELAVPTLSSRVIDQTNVLTDEQERALVTKINAIEASTGAQLAILVVGSTAPEDIAQYANRVGKTWKLGRADVGDGILIVLASGDRKMRVEVMRALEGGVPDIAAARVIDNQMKPAFKQGQFYAGFDAALDKLSSLITEEKLKPRKTYHSNGMEWTVAGVMLLFGLVIGFWMWRRHKHAEAKRLLREKMEREAREEEHRRRDRIALAANAAALRERADREARNRALLRDTFPQSRATASPPLRSSSPPPAPKPVVAPPPPRREDPPAPPPAYYSPPPPPPPAPAPSYSSDSSSSSSSSSGGGGDAAGGGASGDY